MAKSHKLSTSGGTSLGQNPFEALSGRSLPSAPVSPASALAGASSSQSTRLNTNRGRVEIRRSTAGRGGKTVTVVDGFTGIGLPEKERLAKTMQKICGCGGTVKEGRIEIQGDKRELVTKVLSNAGFRPVMAGG